MRLIRSVLRPYNADLSGRFQRCQVIKPARACLYPELIETSNLVHGSNVQWCGRSYAASSSSNTVEAKKERRRISKDERRSMVKKYFNKYREMNAGKFPTVSDAMKDVGGSYYFVREILQELIYKSKMSPIGTKDTSREKIVLNKDEISTNTAEVSQTRKLEDSLLSEAEIRSSNSNSFEPKQGRQSSTKAKSVKSKDVGTQSHCSVDESKITLPSDPENNIREETVCKDKMRFDGLQPKADPQESTEISRRELPRVPAEDAEPQRKSSMWTNLKSFANEILSIWKRS